MSIKPIIGLSADCRIIEPHPNHCVGDKYVRAVISGAGGLPWLLPAAADLDLDEVLARLDGLVLPGAYSNIEPHHYRGQTPDPESPRDPARDAVDLGLIPRALEMGIPLLALCRGFQALNVALGGSILQKVHEVDGLMDHRENKSDPVEVQYAVSHPVELVPGGLLAGLTAERAPMVNSLHGQGVDTLGDGLRVEARAPDGLIEAFSVPAARAFAVGVQWHPEWRFSENPFYASLWGAFREACLQRRRGGSGVSVRALNQ